MSGVGLENTVKYRWIQQPNKLFTILDIPIFMVSEGVVSKEELETVLKNLLKMKEIGFYSRVHLGHHVKEEDRKGVGYVDDPYIKGNVLYANFVEIIPEVFNEMKTFKKYPYVSVEFSRAELKITTVALLETQPPFFKFPLIDITENEEKQEKFSQFFYIWQNRAKKIFFNEKGYKMTDNIDEKNVKDEKGEKDEKKEEIFSEGEESQLDRIEALLKEHDTRLKELFDMEVEWHDKGQFSEKAEKDTEEKETTSKDKGKVEKKPFPSPDSVAYSEMYSRIQALEKMLFNKDVDSKLNAICGKKGLNFSEQSSILSKFSTVKDKENYILALETSISKHPMNDLSRFSQKASTSSSPLKKEIEKKYFEITEGNNDESVRKFQAIWGNSPEKFVEFYTQFPEKLGELTKN